MPNIPFQTYVPELVESAAEAAGGFIGRSLMDSLRKSFTSSSQVQRGDYFMDQSRALLQNHLQLIELHDQSIIHRKYQKLVQGIQVANSVTYLRYNRLREAKQGLDSHDGSKFQKFIKARKYRRVSKETYEIVKVIPHYHRTGFLP